MHRGLRSAGATRPVLFALCSALAFPGRATAQDFEWSRWFAPTWPDSYVNAIETFDDASGAGQVAYFGGSFRTIGGCDALAVARWDGVAWTALGDGLGNGQGSHVHAFEEFDSGSGVELVAGGSFANSGATAVKSIARWNGAAWAPLVGSNGEGVAGDVHALLDFDDGGGDALWVAGAFMSAGGISAARVARWTGSDWSNVGAGVNGPAYCLCAFDDGTGPKIYLGGTFTLSGGNPAQHVVRWNGSTWQQVGAGLPGDVGDLFVFDDGSGPKLYACGTFPGFVASWDGVQWSTVGGGANASVNDLTAFDDGDGLALYAAGSFTSIGGSPALRVAKWDGTSWSTFGGVDDGAGAIAGADFGAHGGRRLIVGGSFEFAGPVTGNEVSARYLAHFDGSTWAGIGDAGQGTSDRVLAFALHDDGRGEALYAGGDFELAGGQLAGRVARWDGRAWEGFGADANDEVWSLASFDDGSGEALYVGGAFTDIGGLQTAAIARWDGSNWSTVGAVNASGIVYAMRVFDDGSGSALYAGGDFTTLGGVFAPGVARWNGSTWSAVGGGFPGEVHAFEVFDDGSGPALYAGGGEHVGVYDQGRMLRWNGATWTTVGGGVDDYVYALQSFDDGSGPALYVGGELLVAGGSVAVDHLGRWNGTSWSAVLATHLERRVRALTVFDEGDGPHLYAGGMAAPSGGIIGRVEGTTFVPLADFVSDGHVFALQEFDDGRAPLPALYAGGGFDGMALVDSEFIARWANGVAEPATSYCTAGTTANGCTATMSSTGEARRCLVSGFDVDVAGVEGQKLGILFFGFGQASTHWGSGTSYVCVSPPTTRASTQSSGGTVGACDGAFTLDFNAWMYANPYKAPAPGTDVFVQAWFRDPPSPKGTSLSDALQFEVAP